MYWLLLVGLEIPSVPGYVTAFREAMAAWALELATFSEEEQKILASVCFQQPDILQRAFKESDDMDQFEQAARELFPAEDEAWLRLWSLWEASKTMASSRADRLASVSTPDIQVWAHKRARRTGEAVAQRQTIETRVAPPAGAAVPKWPTRRKARLASAATQQAKDLVEDEERQRWANEALAIARMARLPLVVRLSETSHAGLMVKALCRDLRATTLRKRVRDARRMVGFLEKGFDHGWPSDLGEVLEYASARAAEPCGKSVLSSFQAALYFFERGGGVAPDSMLSKDPILTSVLAGLQRDLEGGGAAPVAALREPILFTALREQVVMDSGRPLYHRAYAWWKNVQSWATMRFADHVGLDPTSLRLSDGALRGKLTRTKTTGRDKKTGSRAFIVSGQCYLLDAFWLPTGFEIWQSYLTERPYFLALPDEALNGIIPCEAAYVDACGMSRALLGSFLDPARDGEAASPLLLPECVGIWKEHSPRHNMPSWVASIMDVSEDWLNLLGGWVTRGTVMRYIETAEHRIRLMQEATARKLRDSHRGRDLVDEGKLFHELGALLAARGVHQAEIDAQCARLRWSALPGSCPGEGQKVSVPVSSDEETGPPEEVMPRPDWTPDTDMRHGDSLPRELLGQYSVSIGAKSGHRCLHLLGACHRVPELHYHDYILYEDRPASSEYHEYCRQCWPQTAVSPGDGEASSSGSSSEEEV